LVDLEEAAGGVDAPLLVAGADESPCSDEAAGGVDEGSGVPDVGASDVTALDGVGVGVGVSDEGAGVLDAGVSLAGVEDGAAEDAPVPTAVCLLLWCM